MYCDFTADKRYQLADWRIRPLPEEMLFYARSDTHFLLFIYDNLRNALVQRANSTKDLVNEVLSRSEKTALNVHFRKPYNVDTGMGPGGWFNLAKKRNNALFGKQKAIFTAVHSWRDRVSREEDESTR